MNKAKKEYEKTNPKCFDKREDCFAKRGNCCTILTSTFPAEKLCPFYKGLLGE